MKTATCVLFFVLFCFSVSMAQEVKSNDKKTETTLSIKKLNTAESTGDSIVFKDDSDNHLLTITDEGTTGSITIPPGSAPGTTTNKLYNVGSTLFFDGNPILGSGGATSLNDLSDAIFDGSSLFLGSGAGTNNTGSNNTTVGINALHSNTSGFANTAIGSEALYSNTTGSNNTTVGINALHSNTSGSADIAIGSGALYTNTTGNYNIANGYNALVSNTTGNNNIAIGTTALYENNTGHDNIAIGGFEALVSNTTGSINTAIGSYALYYNATGSYNIANGYNAAYNNTTGRYNIANGYSALYANTTGNSNIASGYESLFNNTTGGSNTAYGYEAGFNLITGSNNTLIGYNAEPSSSTVSNEITLGNITVSSLRCNVQTITSLSDMRDKRNIRDLPLGLDFIMTIKPRMFNWDRRDWYQSGMSDGSKMQQTPTAGFVAQELDEAQTNANAEWLNLVLKSNPNKLEATYGNLLPVMVKAIQDLKKENDELKERLDKLNSSISTIVKNEVSKVLSENFQTDQKYVKIN